MEISIHLLQPSDVGPLFEFEVENRECFNQFVPARDDSFYSDSGVADQVKLFLKEYQNGELIPMLIKDANGVICGRINVRDISKNGESGELGYRVGRAFGSKGVASNAVRKLLTYLSKHSSLKYIDAYALVGNVGSNKVLTNTGFDLVERVQNYAVFKGQQQNANYYRKAISV